MCNTFIEKNVTRVKREYFFVFAKPLVFYFSLLFFFFPLSLCIFLCLVNTHCVSPLCIHWVLTALSSRAIVWVNLCRVRHHPLEQVQSRGEANLLDLCLPAP